MVSFRVRLGLGLELKLGLVLVVRVRVRVNSNHSVSVLSRFPLLSRLVTKRHLSRDNFLRSHNVHVPLGS